MKIKFCGATRIVTGSNILVETKESKFVIDCGLFQGKKEEEEKNYSFPYDPSSLDFMILSHAHIDHCGRIPKLVKDKFSGPIFSTYATRDLSEVMLKDSSKIQANDLERENRKRLRAGEKLLSALYDDEDVKKSMRLFRPAYYGEIVTYKNVKIRFRDAGHILGSSIIEIWVKEGENITKICFTGDLGTKGHNIIRDPEYIDSCDYLIIESTYGNTIHENYEKTLKDLVNIIIDTTDKGGKVIVPSFAVGRTQELIYELNSYFESNKEKMPPIFVDSPMAIEATRVFMRNSEVFNDRAKERIQRGDNVFTFDNLFYTSSVEDSKFLNEDPSPMVIISSSGMANAGRVRHHLKHNLWDSKNRVVFVGYQAQGTLGRILLDGIDKVKIFGEWIKVNAKIDSLFGFSAHADSLGLMDFIDNIKDKPREIFLVHGEMDEMIPFEKKINSKYGDIISHKPIFLEEFELEKTHREYFRDYDINSEINNLQKELDAILLKMKKLSDRNPSLRVDNEEDISKIKRLQEDLDKNIMLLNMYTGK